MIKAGYTYRRLVVDILCSSFYENQSVNYVIKEDRLKKQRIRRLMEYSFDLCFDFGKIYLSEDKSACALTLLPDRKRASLKTILLDAKLAFTCIGLSRIFKVLEREAMIKKNYPSSNLIYLWFIGVLPSEQRKGTGSRLLAEIINESQCTGRPVYLETSMPENLNFYKKQGFEVYNKLEKPHSLFLVRRTPDQNS